MMRRIWAGIAATWAVIAIFVVLAASQRPAFPVAGTAVVMARTASGALVPVTPTSSAVHATTSSSRVATGGSVVAGQAVTYVKTANGSFVPVSSAAPAAAVTRTS
jgi:hypothetical protein